MKRTDPRDGDQATSRAKARELPSWPEPLEPTLVTSDPCDVVRFLHDVVKLTDSEVAEATGSKNQMTVQRWRSQDTSTTPRCTDRLDDLRAIAGLLLNSRLLYPEEVGRFLRSRNETLGYRRPLTLLAEGNFDAVRDAAEQLLKRVAGYDKRPPAHTPAELPSGMTALQPTAPCD